MNRRFLLLLLSVCAGTLALTLQGAEVAPTGAGAEPTAIASPAPSPKPKISPKPKAPLKPTASSHLPALLQEVEKKYVKARTMMAEFTQVNEIASTGQKKTSSGVI